MQTITAPRLQIAHRPVAAHPATLYTSPVPEVLLATPVLAVELNADGSVRPVRVWRSSREARHTTQLAIDAVRTAAPFGDVSRPPKPWRSSETFLFSDQRRFERRSLEP